MVDDDVPDGSAPHWPGDRGGHIWPKDREVVRDDGARIRYTVRGPDGAPCVVLCAGYLCPDNFWAHFAPRLAERSRVVMLNYRGVGASMTAPPRRRRGRTRHELTIPTLAADVAAVLDAEGVRSATVVGHSMGCQVALEVYRQLGRERVDALVLVTGPFESPFVTFYGSSIAASVWPFIYAGLSMLPSPVLASVPKLVRLPFALDVGQLVRAIGPHTPRDLMEQYLEHLSRLDADVALRLARGMHRHSARDVLACIDVPTLAIAGGRDTFSPPAIARTVIEHVEGAELVEVEEGTHAALLEFPDEIADAVLDFLDRRVALAR